MHSLKRAFILFAPALLLISATAQNNPDYVWKTLTGQPGGIGSADGAGTQARFYHPYGVATSSAGELYVADTFNNTIRKITTNGAVTTFAGSALQVGSADGTGAAARFSSPSSLTVDSAGTLYVVDTYNNTIRKVTSEGVVTTLAGSAGQVGSADGAGGAARFNEPYGVAVDGHGDLYVTDSGNSTLRKVTSEGYVTTIAGSAGQFGSADGTNSAARFSYPAGVAVDAAGNVFVADLNNSTIRKVTSDGVVTTLAGTPGNFGSADGTNSEAQFSYPAGLVVDTTGHLFVADSYSSTLRKITSDGLVSTLAGTADLLGSEDGTNGAARFNNPSGIAVDGAGNLYVADTDNSILRKVTSAGVVTTLAGSLDQSGSADADGSVARFNAPYGVALDNSGNAFVADTFNNTIRQVSGGGLVGTLAGKAGEAGSTDGINNAARFDGPYAITADNAGNLFVADAYNRTIRKITPDGLVATLAGSAGQSGNADGTNETARFSYPLGVAADDHGNLFVTDFLNHTLRKITTEGVVTTLAGSAGLSGSTDGTNNTARFNGPFGVATDGLGNVYVTDSGNHTVRKVTSAGVVTTLAGSAGLSGSTDGTNSEARFFAPAGIAADGAGNLYLADIGNATIRKVTGDGVVTTLAGHANQIGSADGIGEAARFFVPVGVATDGTGNLLVTDIGNHNLRRVSSAGVVTTLAGGVGEAGSNDVAAVEARFFNPSALALDQAGNLFVADTYNNSIRRVTSDGAVTTLAGLPGKFGSADGMGSSARFAYPFGLAADSTGNLYVADSYNSTIRKLTGGGLVTTFAGSVGQPGHADGLGAAARFSYPSGIAVDNAGNVYVADYDNFTVRKISSSGDVTTLAGSAGIYGDTDGVGASARFGYLNGLALDGEGNLYVADSGNATLRKISPDGEVTTLAGSPGELGCVDGQGGAARFDYPFGVAVDDAGNVFVADAGNSTLRKITREGYVTTIGGQPYVMGGREGTGSSATFAGPTGVAVDAFGLLYVADSGNNRISRGIRLPILSIITSDLSVRVSWPSAAVGFALEQSSSMSNSNSWIKSSYALSDDGTNKSVAIDPPAGTQFFRLISDD